MALAYKAYSIVKRVCIYADDCRRCARCYKYLRECMRRYQSVAVLAQARSDRFAMLTASRYKQVQKRDETGAWKPFNPLRAAGLACELGHKLCRDKGLGRLQTEDFARLELSGGTRLLRGAHWQEQPSCTLEVAASERSFAFACVQKQRALFNDLAFNCWAVDKRMPGRLGSYDFLGDFSTATNFGACGRVWVELKVVGACRFEEKLAEHREKLEPKLARVVAADSTVEALLLVVTKAQRNGHAWLPPKLSAELLLASGGGWQQVVGDSLRRKRKRGTAGASKPLLGQVWKRMGPFERPPGTDDSAERLGHLKHFLLALGLAGDSPGRRARAWNRVLRKAGRSVLQRVQLETPGKKPWLGTKATFRFLYTYCV